MKKLVFVFVLVLSFFAVFQLTSAAASPTIKINDATVEYTPDGYMPSATVTSPLDERNISYLVIDKKTGEPVSLPITNAGEYTVKAYATVGGTEISDTANVTITPVKVTISIEYDRLRYTGDDIIPEYTVSPAWTADYFRMDITYTYYKNNNKDSAAVVQKPHALGTYFVKMTPIIDGNNFVCDGKAYILTVAESGGRKLSDSEASAPVGSGISAKLEDLTVVYDGNAPTVSFETAPFVATCQLYYRRIGTNDDQIVDVPKEPGEYEVTAVLCGKVLATSTLIIKKKIPTYSIEQTTYTYSPSGIIPLITSPDDDNLAFNISAFLVNENDEIISQASLPLKRAGKYLLIINPKLTTYYEDIYSPEYIYIEKCKPTISSDTHFFGYDSFPKRITYTISPEWVESGVSYYKINSDREIIESLGVDAPVNIGDYLAEIKVNETENVEGTVVKVYFSITATGAQAPARPHESKTEFVFIGEASTGFIVAMIALPLGMIALFVVLVFMQRKKR